MFTRIKNCYNELLATIRLSSQANLQLAEAVTALKELLEKIERNTAYNAAHIRHIRTVAGQPEIEL